MSSYGSDFNFDYHVSFTPEEIAEGKAYYNYEVRPIDGSDEPGISTNEVVESYRYVMQLCHQPAALVLSRQLLPTLDRSRYAPASGVSRGAYVLAEAPGGNPEVIIIASGSEVSLAIEAHEKLVAEGIRSRVVSMPSWEIFVCQSEEYRNSVLPSNVKSRVSS